MWRFWVLGVLAVLLAGCGERLPTYRYKLTVEVETPNGLRTGSSVIEVRSRIGSGIPSSDVAGGVFREVSGEAVAVDLPNGETLFVLLTDDPKAPPDPSGSPRSRFEKGDAGHLAQYIFDDRIKLQSGQDSYEAVVTGLSEGKYAADVPRHFYPLMVRFRDIDDPTSVERVDPDALAASFGEGYALRGMKVETTSEGVTSGIVRSRIPSFGPETGFAEWYKGLRFDDPKRVTLYDFERK